MQKIGKEVKIGLAVIGVLLVAFGYVLVKKLTQGGDPGTDTAAATSPSTSNEKPKGGRPTVVTASDSDGSDAAANQNRSRWSVGGERGNQGEVNRGDPAADSRSPFAPTASEAAAMPEPRGSSRFAGDDNTSTVSDSGESHRRDPHADDHHFGAVQASDSAPVAANGTDRSTASDARSIFAKGDANKSAGDKDSTSDGSAAAKSPADPFQSRFGNAAAPSSNAFERRTADAARSADASATTDGSPRKTISDDSGFKPTVPDDPRADGHNPLRRPDAQPAIQPPPEPADAASRWSGPSRAAAADSAPAPATIPMRAGSAFDGTANAAAARFSTGANAAQPLVADESAAKPGQYIVQPNDNYWTISEKVYGTGGYFKAIFEHNRRQHPNAERLQVGEMLLTPDVASLQRDYPDLCPKPGHAAAPQHVIPASARLRPGTKVYVVEEGDTLFEIARRQLGKPSRWGEIYQLNREVLGSDFDYLKPGTELLLPTTDTRPDPIARQPNGTAEK